MSNDFIENALTRLRDDSELVALRAQNNRLKADLEKSDNVVFIQCVENERLKARVERLTEAGNQLWAFAHNCVSLDVYQKTAQEKINDWNAAKEGKQTA